MRLRCVPRSPRSMALARDAGVLAAQYLLLFALSVSLWRAMCVGLDFARAPRRRSGLGRAGRAGRRFDQLRQTRPSCQPGRVIFNQSSLRTPGR